MVLILVFAFRREPNPIVSQYFTGNTGAFNIQNYHTSYLVGMQRSN
jgi:hypothetical protein